MAKRINPLEKGTNAINKYGIKNFKISFLEINIENEEWLNNIESYYIKKLNTIFPNGYNFLEGDTHGAMHEITKNKLAEIKSRNNNYTLLDNLGNIHKFKNATAFARKMNVHQPHIMAVIHGKIRTCHGFHLIGTDLRFSPFSQKIHKVKDKNDKIYEIYNITTFAKEHNLSYHKLRKLLIGETGACGNFTRLDVDFNSTEYKRGNSEIHKTHKYEYFILSKDNQDFTVKNSELDNFCKEHKIHRTCIYQLVKKHITQTNGFILKYVHLF